MEENPVKPEQVTEKAAQESSKPKDYPPITPVDVSKIDPPKDTSAAEADKNKRKRKPLSCFEIWTIILAFIGILVAGGTGVAIIWQDRIAARTLSEIQKQYPELQKSATAAYAQVRPWIKIDKVDLRTGAGPIKTLEFHWPTTGKLIPPELQIVASVTNVGHSVAQGVEVIPELFFGQFNSQTWHDVVTREEDKFCKSVADRKTSGEADTIFPSDSKVWDTVPVGTIPPNVTTPASALIICVDYEGSQTQAWFGLYENNSILIKPGVDVDAASLRLIRDESGDHAY